MGTRADFYVGRGLEAEWIGSIAWDGYPDGVPEPVLTSTSEQDFRERVEAILAEKRSATRPEMGWPWPWEDSNTTDYAYAWDGGVFICGFGRGWKTPGEYRDAVDSDAGLREDEPEAGDRCVFPDMSARMSVTLGPRSGVLVFGVKR